MCTKRYIAKCSIAYELCVCVARRNRNRIWLSSWSAILSNPTRKRATIQPIPHLAILALAAAAAATATATSATGAVERSARDPHSENHTTRPIAVAPWPAYNRMMAHQAMRVIGATFGGGSARNAIGRVPREPHTHLPLLGLGALSHPTVRCMTTPAVTEQAVIVDTPVNLEWVSGQPDGRPAGGAERPAQAREPPLGWLTALRLVR